MIWYCILKKNNEKQAAIRAVSRQTIVPNTRRDTMSSWVVLLHPLSYFEEEQLKASYTGGETIVPVSTAGGLPTSIQHSR
jgi:hypothetical protein